MVTNVLATILPVILMLFIGNLCRRLNIFSRQGIDAMKKLVVNIALSAVLVNAFATMDYSVSNMIITVIMFIACIIAWLAGKLVLKSIPAINHFTPFLVTGFEAGMLGYSLYGMLYGYNSISEFAKLDLGQVLFVFTFYKIMLGLNEPGDNISFKKLLIDMFTSPTIIAILSGVFIGITKIVTIEPVYQILKACTDFISAPTSAVILLTIGYDLVLEKIPVKSTFKAVGFRLAIMVVIRIVLGYIFTLMNMPQSTFCALNVMLILPPPFVIAVFTEDEDNQTFLSSVLTVSTLLTILGFIIIAVMNSL